MTDLLERIDRNIQTHCLLKRGDRVLAAVSGGLDSMVLLHALHQLASRRGWRLAVAHFNHRLRGRAANADEKFVRRVAAALKLPMVAGRADVKAFARKSKLSVEMAARKLRHEFLARGASRRKMDAIALAHHADDQVELFFLRLLRGAGGEGLSGMKWRSPSPADPSVILVRPLLNVGKKELRAWARADRIDFREDATNASRDFLRNRIRHELLPLLRRKYQPGLDQAVLRLMDIVGAESAAVGETARQWLEAKNRSRRPHAPRRVAAGLNFAALPRAVQRKILQRQLIERGLAPDFDLIERLRLDPGRPVSVGVGLTIVPDPAGGLKLERIAPGPVPAPRQTLSLTGNSGRAVFGARIFRWRIQSRQQSRPVRSQPGREIFDASRVGPKIVLRHWEPGDRFQPIGLGSAAKLQDLFINAKIPRARRRELAVGVAENGEIFWVEGLRIGETCKVTSATRRRLIWRWPADNRQATSARRK